MDNRGFVDHYETLQVSPNADAEMIERVHRHLAKRYHPDNQATGNRERFAAVQDAFTVLGHPEQRAAYDVKYDENRSKQWKIFDQDSATDSREEDRRIFHGILSVLYAAKRQDPRHGGMGAVNLERTLGVTQEHMAFPMWYLKEHGWVVIQDNGQYTITVSGVDKITSREFELPKRRLLKESSEAEAQDQATSHPLAVTG